MFNGAALRELREANGMSREALAHVVGRSWNTIRRWETSRTQPNSHTVILLASLFECDERMLTSTEVEE